MTLDTARLLALLTWPPCGAILFITACRLNAMPHNTRFAVVLEYAIWATIGIVIPLLPMVGQWPDTGMVAIAWALAGVLALQNRAWAGDVAPDTATDHAPLEGAPSELR